MNVMRKRRWIEAPSRLFFDLCSLLLFSFFGWSTLFAQSEPWNISPAPQVAREARVIKKGLLAVSPEDRATHTELLKKSNAGLIRLLPRETYDSQTYGTRKKLSIRGGGAYYSFFYLTHEYGYGSDLELDHNRLSVGFAGADYGMLTNLGKTDLASITEKDLRARFLSKYTAPRDDPDARCERRRFVMGETIDGQSYRNSLPVEIGASYLVRSIVYGHYDILVAFQVTRRAEDGSIIIAWKLLKEFAPRELENVNATSKCNGPIVIKNSKP
jgi:hypothetical protein